MFIRYFEAAKDFVFAKLQNVSLQIGRAVKEKR